MNRFAKFLVAGAAAVTMTAAFAQNKGTIKIAVHVPLSGPQSITGDLIKLGSQVAIDEYAKMVTSQGFKLELQPEDDQATPNVGVANANRMINDPDLLVVIGHYNSGVAIPSSEVYAKVGLPFISPANTNPLVTDRDSVRAIANRLAGRDDVQGPAGATFALKTLKAKKIYVINDKTAYGAGLASAFEAAMKKGGAVVALSTGVDEKDTDFSSILNRAAVEKPDLIYFGAIYSQAGLLIKQARQKGIKSAIMGGDGFDSPDLQKLAGDSLTDVYFTAASLPISKLNADGKKFVTDFKTKFNKEVDGYGVQAYDCTHTAIIALANAIKANGGQKPTRQQVAAEIRKVNFTGLSGKVAFNSRGDRKVAPYSVIKAASEYAKSEAVSVLEIPAPHN